MKAIILFISTVILSTCSNNTKKLELSTLFEKELKVISINNSDVSDLDLTLMLQNNEKSITGFAGCNRFFGTYSIDGNAVAFSKVGATKIYCSDARISENEKLFLNSLSKVSSYKPTKSESIELLNEKNKVLITLKY
ncbi:META domain-containing protein [Patiriisocius sp. Uisw_017]|jgi:heat shock protein HslJ|uniref:META domain-containing protein n=1 Tax=Patiriisocius sp. Uisw_017 TaxID=3230968 RepID=UPI0039EAE96E